MHPRFRPALAALLFCATTAAQALPVIEIYAHIGPTKIDEGPGGIQFASASYETHAANGLEAMARGLTQYGGSQAHNPAAFETLGPVIVNGHGHVTVGQGDLFATEFANWRGNLTPTGAFSQERGTHFRAGVAIRDNMAFRLAHVILSATFDAPYGVPAGCCMAPLGDVIMPGSERFAGLWWGLDGVAGTADDVHYNSINPLLDPTLPLNEAFFLGFGEFAYAPLVPGVEPELIYAEWQAFADSLGGASFTYSYSLGDVSSSVTVTPIPEPSTYALMALGLGMIWLTRRQRAARSA